MLYKKILSAIICVSLLIHPVALLADEIASSSASVQSPTPIISPTQAPDSTPVASPSASISSEISPTPAQTSIANSGDSTSSSASSSAQITTTVANTNDADVATHTDTYSSTGDNHAQDNIISDTKTGNTQNTTNVLNDVNTNIVGTDIHKDVVVINNDHTRDIDLAHVPTCDDRSEAAREGFVATNSGDNTSLTQSYISALYNAIYNSNKAKVVNDITMSVNTGGNTSKDIVNLIDTGNASATANIFNLVNTNLVGNCGYFGIVTVFGNQTGDIILPYELGYLGVDSATALHGQNTTILNSGGNADISQSSSNSDTTTVKNSNTASIVNDFGTDASTGNNSTSGVYGQVTTGNAVSDVQTIDKANTNIVGDRWVLVMVNYTGTWDGGVQNWSGTTESKPGYKLMWVKLPAESDAQASSTSVINSGNDSSIQNHSSASSDTTIENTNDAVVENKVRLTANTGNNSAEGVYSQINTGDAYTRIRSNTLANTNIVGHNWFFAMINIFGNFVGNVIYPRPDLEISNSADKGEFEVGEAITYTIRYINKGQIQADNVVLTDSIPQGTELISFSAGGTVSNGGVRWNIGTVDKNATGSVTVIVKVKDRVDRVINTAQISTITDEPNTANNISAAYSYVRNTGGVITSSQLTAKESPISMPSTASTTQTLGMYVTAPDTYSGVYRVSHETNTATDSADILTFGATTQVPSTSRSFCQINFSLCMEIGLGIAIPVSMYAIWKRRDLFTAKSSKRKVLS